MLQFACLLVDRAFAYIEESNVNGPKLRRLMNYAHHCLLTLNCVDPANKYHGHLLFSRIMSKINICSAHHKRIALQGT